MLQPVSCDGLTFSESCLIEEYHFLFGVAALLRPKRILEIGANMGLGTISLWKGATGLKPNTNVHIVTIEKNPDCLPYIVHNWAVQECPKKYLHIINDFSANALPDLVEKKHWFGLCFVDGDHSYEGARADWDATQQLADTWILHDSTQMVGVRRLVQEIRETSEYDVFGFDEYPFGLQWAEKQKKYCDKRSIPGITLVKRKGSSVVLGYPEREWLEIVRGHK
jgi:hypothetical protein